MRTYKSRQGRKAATVVCFAFAVVTLAISLFFTMSYQVIARKYRPQRFNDVVGQEHVTQTLANAIQQNRIAHAYLFCGPRGTGKTTIARIFAKCLNCTDGPKVDFDADDPRCREIAEGRSLDVIEIDGASNRGIEEIRELRDTVRYAPASSRFKIYIIDEVHMLTKEAFNALLKTLEEPPAHAKFMFATTEPEKVLPTILSRCQRFDLRRIPTTLIVEHLARIAELESVRIDPPALHAIARGADGGMRDAESTLDQLISFCGEQIEEPDVLSMFGLAAQGQILALAHAILAGDIESCLRLLDELTRHGKDLGRLLADLLGHFRNLLVFKVAGGDLKLLQVSETESRSLAEQASQVEPEALGRIMEVLADHEGRLRDAASKRILIEVAILKSIDARRTLPIDTILKTLNHLRQELPATETTGAPRHPPSPDRPKPMPAVAPRTPDPKPSARSSPPPAEAPVATTDQSREGLSEQETPGSALCATAADAPGDLDQLWTRLLELVGSASPFTRSYLLEAHPVSWKAQTFTVGFDPEFADHLEFVDNPKNRALLQSKLAELGCGEVQVRFVKADAPPRPPSATPPAPAAGPVDPVAPPPNVAPDKPRSSRPVRAAGAPLRSSDPADFKNDPLIRKALDVFKGQIVEVHNP
jgi:DNA polymerase III subunit gamma/tau